MFGTGGHLWVLCARAAFVAALLCARPANAYLLHEHAAITERGIARLDPTQSQALHRAWAALRGNDERYCEDPVASWSGGAGTPAACVSMAVMPALAADHSCSPTDLVNTVHRPWLLGVLREAARVEAAVAQPERSNDLRFRLETRRDHDRALTSLDEEYLSRAGSNASHFAQSRTSTALSDYLRRALAPSEELNALGVYAWLHALALRAACDAQSDAGRALLTELYALHFLEDAFASGHIVGSWGDKPTRSGTHDYYCENGLEVTTWAGRSYVAHGDGFMTSDDLDHASDAVRESLAQLAAALQGGDACVASVTPSVAALDTCSDAHMPPGAATVAAPGPLVELIERVAQLTPMPFPMNPAPPRFYNDLGLIVGATIEGSGSALWDERAPYAPLPNHGAARMTGMGYFGAAIAGNMPRYVDSQLLLGAGVSVDFAMFGEPRTGIRFGGHLPFGPLDLVFGLARLACPRSWAWCRPAALVPLLLESAAGGTYGVQVHKVHLLSERWTLQFVLGREAWATYFWPQGAHPASWSVQAPVLTLRAGGANGGQIFSQGVFQLGAEFVTAPNEPLRVGLYLSLGYSGHYTSGAAL